MKYSIITTCFNSEKYIEETLESVLSQRGDFEIEYIIIDAGSTDNTLEIIDKYKSLVEANFYKNRNNGITMRVISEKDNGMYDGISKGFKLVTGDIVAYINADDFYLPNAFSCVADIFKTYTQVKWLTGAINSYNHKGQINFYILPYRFKNKFIKKGFYGKHLGFIQQESTFWRKELLDMIDLDEFRTYKYAGDFYLWFNFSKHTKLNIVYSLLSGFRNHLEQKSQDKDGYFKEFNNIIGDYEISFLEKIKVYFEKRKWDQSNEKKLIKNPNIIWCPLGGHDWMLNE